MIIEVFVILLAISLILITIGYATSEASFIFIGLAFLFVLSTAVLIPNSLEVKAGENITTSFTYDNTTTLVSETQQVNDFYNNPSTRFYGIWLAVLAGAGFFFVWRGVNGGSNDE